MPHHMVYRPPRHTAEIATSAALGIAALVQVAIYLTDMPDDPRVGNVLLTSAAVCVILAALLAVHWDVRRSVHRNHVELRYQRYYQMTSNAEDIEAERDR